LSAAEVPGADSVNQADRPVFVLTAARSGSTLLRFILDAHPDLCCPPELGVGAACAQLARVWSVTEGVPRAGVLPLLGPGHVTERAAAAMRSAITAAITAYLEERGAARWCDKSLDTVMWADLVARIWPDAQFVCLYRHCMDVIASGLEACRWGLDSFGFERYTAQYPGNNVAAAGACWVTAAGQMIDFEKRHEDRALRVRYEDLVADPEAVAGRVFGFLGVAGMPGISSLCFAAAHDANGPGDAKIWFTTKVTAESVGRGAEVPGNRLPAPLQAAINNALRELGYVEVDEDWNAEQRRTSLLTLPGGEQPRPEELAPGAPGSGGSDREDAGLVSVASAVEERDGAISPAMLGEIARSWPALAGRVLGIDLIGPAGGLARFRWRAGGPAASGSDEDAVLSAPVSVWRAVLDGEANLFTELFGNRIVSRGIPHAHLRRTEEVHALGVLLGVAQLPAAARDPGAAADGAQGPAGSHSAGEAYVEPAFPPV
jgi:protein-tyrosine sulfotransferase